MKKELNNYYLEQLQKVSDDTSRTIQITASPGGQTNWMTLNNESASVLVNWLKEHYNITTKSQENEKK